MRRGQGAIPMGRRAPRELSSIRSYALERASRDGRIAIAESDKGWHRQAPDERSLQTCRLCGWKWLLLQWTVSSILLKRKYPGKQNRISSLRATILCKVAGVNASLQGGEPTNPRSPRVCHEADRSIYQAL